MLPDRFIARIALTVLGLVSLIHYVAKWFDVGAWAEPTQWCLMPVLALVVFGETARPRGKLIVGTLCALGLSWLGDTVPSVTPEQQAFLVMVGFFLLAQVTYIIVFVPLLDRAFLRKHRALALVYVAAVATLGVFCAPGAADLFVPVFIYGLCLGTMAFCAHGVHPWAGAGGALFFVSDGLIAINNFVPNFPLSHNGFWVMVTYVPAQLLIVLGVLAKQRSANAVRAAHRG